MNYEVHEIQQHGLKVVQRSFKDYVDIKTLNSEGFAEWLRQQCVVEHEVIQVLKGQCFICKLINYEKLVRECSNCFALDAEWTHLIKGQIDECIGRQATIDIARRGHGRAFALPLLNFALPLEPSFYLNVY